MTTVVAVEVAGVLDSSQAERSEDSRTGGVDALLFFLREGEVVVLPREINFLGRLWGKCGECDYGARGRLPRSDARGWTRSEPVRT